MRKTNRVVLASTNRHKLEEFLVLFKKYPEIEIVPADEYIKNPEKLSLVETSDHYYDNAIAKARACNQGCHYPSLADDSGLEVDALQGKPGVRSHRYAITKNGQTQDQANNLKLLEELKNVPEGKRTARFICHLAMIIEGVLVHTVGTLEGRIAQNLNGQQGFGYDPLFIPNGYEKTLAELGADLKNKLSHRAKAVDALMEDIKRQDIVLAKP